MEKQFSLQAYSVSSELLRIPETPFSFGENESLLELVGEFARIFGGVRPLIGTRLPRPATLEGKTGGKTGVRRRLV